MSRSRIRVFAAAALVAVSALVVAAPAAPSAGSGVVLADPERCC